MQNQTIKSWAEDDRPREKLLLKGYAALSNAELLAILINNGTKDKSAVDVAKELLAAVNNDLQKLAKLTVKEILKLKVKGIGEAKAVTIAAALEFGLRREAADKKKDVVLTSKDIAQFMRAQLQYKQKEVFVVMYLNNAGKVKHTETVSEGGITATVVDPRVILKKALEHDAVRLVLCHNHPSGDTAPSRHDRELTQKLKEAARLFDMQVVDHIIVSEDGYFSFADAGLL